GFYSIPRFTHNLQLSQDLSLSQRLEIHFLHSTFLRGCWSKFITDNDPMDGDFLLFSYDGCRIFLVSIFRDELPVKPKAPVNIQEISDEDETAGDGWIYNDDDEEEDNDQNMIISLSSGSSEEDNVDTLTKLMEVQGELRLRKGNVLKLLVIQRCILMIPLTLSVDMP
ncbi:unnamed protein product, partial [Brassica oleracea var. botrytis]